MESLVFSGLLRYFLSYGEKMAQIKHGYFSDPQIQAQYPALTRALSDPKSELFRQRRNTANMLAKFQRVPSFREGYVDVDAQIIAEGDNPEEASAALRLIAGEIQRSEIRTTDVAATGQTLEQLAGADITAGPALGLEAEAQAERLGINLTNDTIFAAYRTIFGTTP